MVVLNFGRIVPWFVIQEQQMNSSLAMDSGIGGDYAMYLGLQKAAVACYQKGVAANAFF